MQNSHKGMNAEAKSDFYRKLFALALPIAFQNIISSVLNLVDTFMISSLSTASIAGVTAANKVQFLLFLFLFGISSGSAILTAQYWGAGDIGGIRKVLGLCLVLGGGGAALFTLAAVGAPGLVMAIFTNQAGATAEGIRYLSLVGWSYIPTAIGLSYVFVLRSTGNVRLPIMISLGAIALNTFLNWVLIYGNLGATAMGVEGAAIATLIARIVEMSVLLVVLYAKRSVAAASLKELFSFNKDIIRRYAVTVTPVVGNELIWAMGVTVYDIVYGRMGESVMAAMGITKTIEQVAFFLIFSLGNAGAVILGNQLGTGDMTHVYEYAKKLLRMITTVGLIMMVIILLLSKPIAGIFNVEPIVHDYVVQCIRVFAVVVPVKAINFLVIVGILRSGGDTKFAMYIDGIAVWFVAVPLVILGGLVWKLDIRYVYMLAMTEEVSKVFVSLWRTRSKKWIKNLVNE